MVFSSLIFLFRFLPLILLIYYIVPGKFKNLVLLSGSLVFYAWGEPKYVLIMIFSTLVNYIFGILIEDFKKKNKISTTKYMVVASVIVNLSVLGFFKYADLLINTANKLTGSGFLLACLFILFRQCHIRLMYTGEMLLNREILLHLEHM